MPAGSTKNESGGALTRVRGRDRTVGIDQRRPGGAGPGHVGPGSLRVVFEDDAKDLEAPVGVPLAGGLEEGELLAAGDAPRGPEVDDDRPAPVVGQVNLVAVEVPKGDVGRRRAEERMTTDDDRASEHVGRDRTPGTTNAAMSSPAMMGRREAGRSVVAPYCAVSVPVIVCGWMSQT